MALKKLKGMIWGRFITLFLIFAIPAYFAIIIAGSELGWFDIITWQDFLYIGKSSITFMPEGWAKFFVWFCIPFFFSLPWVAFLIVDANRVGETFSNMGRAMGKVSVGLNVFYNINALFVFVFFLLPFGSPIIGVVASFGLIPWMIRRKTDRRPPRWLTFLPSLLLAAIPIILAIGFCANYGDVFKGMWGVWSGDQSLVTGTTLEKYGLVHYFYGIGYAVAIGAVLAGFASFIYEGASQVSRSVKRPTGFLIIVELLVAAGIYALYLLLNMETKARDIVFYVISGVAIFIGLTEFILRFFKKTKRNNRDNVPIGAYIMLPIFIGVDLIRTANTIEVRNYAITGALVLACLVYLVLFVLAYSFAGETYQSRWSKSRDEDDYDDNDDDDGGSDDDY